MSDMIDRIEHEFKYHAPDEDAVVVHETLRTIYRNTAGAMDQLLPDSREKSIVITKLREAMMWANAAVALNKQEPSDA